MNKQNGIFLYNGILFGHTQKIKLMMCYKWMNLENITVCWGLGYRSAVENLRVTSTQ
jgi:hypothetical protein